VPPATIAQQNSAKSAQIIKKMMIVMSSPKVFAGNSWNSNATGAKVIRSCTERLCHFSACLPPANQQQLFGVRHKSNDARMRPTRTTVPGRCDGDYSFSGRATTRLRICSRSSQSYQRLGGDAARTRPLSREDRGPLLRRNATALPPLQDCRKIGADIGGQILRRIPEADHVFEGAKVSHRGCFRTIGP
jgi:hypothetical protein